jgi:cell wall-associated NlpC family hydrolase
MSMIGAPYRYGGSSPRGFDCSGLVVYSFARTGVSGLPHSAADLHDLARPVSLRELEPGDLLFFRLGGQKPSHVAIYVGGDTFVHAPSSGKRVEKVGLDHVYWGPRLGQAGRLEF